MMSAHCMNFGDAVLIEAKALLCHIGDELGARTVIGIVELGVAELLLVVLGVLGREERAL